LYSKDEIAAIQAPLRTRLFELFVIFLRLGVTAFGGPAAHIALYQDEFVRRRKWLSNQHFLDLLGATNLIPGPNSTEMAIHLGYVRAGLPGLIVSGVSFITPAMIMVLCLAWIYVHFGSLPQIESLLYGIKPVMILIIFQALLGLGKTAIKAWYHAIVGIIALLLYFTGLHPLFILIAGGIVFLGIKLIEDKNILLAGFPSLPSVLTTGAILGAAAYSPATLFFTFLKIGAVLYGSGYVLLAFLQSDFVDRLGWLTQQQLLDAIAIGQITPGPVFTTATFIGYLVGGLQGGLLATLGIFLPSFIFVAISNPIIPRLRQSQILAAILDGVNVTALGLMAAVTIILGVTAMTDAFTVLIALAAGYLLLRFHLNSTWLILGGGLVGLIHFLLT
jgi:chromate transporter